MRPLGNLAIIGSGATAIYLLHHIAKNHGTLSKVLKSITVLERTSIAGCGMPYHPETTDVYNMSNISSEEIPQLPETFYEWLVAQDQSQLLEWKIDPEDLSESEVYPRLPLGAYLNAQYQKIIATIRNSKIGFAEKTQCEVTDISPREFGGELEIHTSQEECLMFDSVIIATGHAWSEEDDPKNGYYGSPWPISKILPQDGTFHNFSIGTLGASLSAFDVVSSLSHRHGEFCKKEERLSYHPSPGSEGFRIVMHASHGSLPHLQFDQVEPFRVIYRHVSREEMLNLRDGQGRLRISTFFDKICRPALLEAFKKDGLADVAAKLSDPEFSLEDFVTLMEDKHGFDDAFAVMSKEMPEARKSVEDHKPIHWKEVVDDLMFTLNFHAELMPAEDYMTLRKTVMPFLMSVIAAMPLPSAEMLLALHDAGKLDLIPGRVSVEESDLTSGQTNILVSDGDDCSRVEYGMFVDCSGQKPLELADYPFQGLVKAQRVRRARASFAKEKSYTDLQNKGDDEHLFTEDGEHLLHTGGIDIDAVFRVIAADGRADSSIFDLAFPHTSGVRPYSYGLQACDATADIVVNSWIEALEHHAPIEGGLEHATEIYEEIQKDLS